MRAHNRGSVAPAGGTAHVRPHGGVSGLSAGVPVKELGLHSLEGHWRVWAGVCMPVCMCDAIRAMCPESIPLAPRPGSVLKLREGERQKPEALTSSHILKTLLFFSKVKNVAASLTWPQHRRRVSVAPPLRCASPVPLRDTSCPVACRSPARVSPAAPLGDGSPENHNLAKL